VKKASQGKGCNTKNTHSSTTAGNVTLDFKYKGTPADAAVTDGGGEESIPNGCLQRQEENTSDFRNI